MFDTGIAHFYTLTNVATSGNMPSYSLTEVAHEYYKARTVGYNRLYRAMGRNVQIDALIRFWENNNITANMVCVLDGGEQFRINSVSLVTDDNGLRCMEASLERIEDKFEETLPVDDGGDE